MPVEKVKGETAIPAVGGGPPRQLRIGELGAERDLIRPVLYICGLHDAVARGVEDVDGVAVGVDDEGEPAAGREADSSEARLARSSPAPAVAAGHATDAAADPEREGRAGNSYTNVCRTGKGRGGPSFSASVAV